MNAKERFIKQCKERFYDCYKDLNGKNVVLFPAGGRANAIILAFREMNIQANILAVLDNNCKEDKSIEGIPVYSADRLEDFIDCIIVICSDTYRNEIKAQVNEKGGKVFDIPSWEGMIEQMLTLHEYKTKIEQDPIGDVYSWIGNEISKERMQFVYDSLEDERSKIVFEKRMRLLEDGDLNDFIKIPVDELQYFDPDVINLTQDEVFVDCGAYVGDTIDSFRKYVGGYKKIIAFEPDKYNCHKIKEYLEKENISNVKVVNGAVGNENREVTFNNLGTAGSSVIQDEGIERIRQVRLDDAIQEPITFLKMDIEGFELDALKGAENTIKTHKPKLAICVYHKAEDPIRILEYLKKIVPEYKFYMRHYTYSQHETVLYAQLE